MRYALIVMAGLVLTACRAHTGYSKDGQTWTCVPTTRAVDFPGTPEVSVEVQKDAEKK